VRADACECERESGSHPLIHVGGEDDVPKSAVQPLRMPRGDLRDSLQSRPLCLVTCSAQRTRRGPPFTGGRERRPVSHQEASRKLSGGFLSGLAQGRGVRDRGEGRTPGRGSVEGGHVGGVQGPCQLAQQEVVQPAPCLLLQAEERGNRPQTQRRGTQCYGSKRTLKGPCDQRLPFHLALKELSWSTSRHERRKPRGAFP